MQTFTVVAARCDGSTVELAIRASTSLQADGSTRHYAASASLGCSKDYATPEAAIRALVEGEAMTVRTITPTTTNKPTVTLADNVVTVTAGGFVATIAARSIERCWYSLSQRPESRARLEVDFLAARLADFFAFLEQLEARGGQVPADAAEQFARRHVELTRRFWHMESRCASWFVVGPANFPTARNAKRLDGSDKARQLVQQHMSAARASVRRQAFPYGEPGDAIRANNPDAPELIREKIAKLQKRHEVMKAANKALRSVRSGDELEMAQAVMDATGWSRALAAQSVKLDCMGRRGFADYELTGALREIKRLEGRLASIERNRARGEIEAAHDTREGTVRVVENPTAARLQLVFPGKPEAATREILKRNGFRWAPSEGAWQRHLNEGGRYAARCVLSALQAA